MSTFWKWVVHIIIILLGLVPVLLFALCIYINVDHIQPDSNTITWLNPFVEFLDKCSGTKDYDASAFASVPITMGVCFVYWGVYLKVVSWLKNHNFQQWVKSKLGNDVKDQYSVWQKTKYDLINNVKKTTNTTNVKSTTTATKPTTTTTTTTTASK